MVMPRRAAGNGFTLVELTISLMLIVLLLAILLPALSKARVTSHRDRCSDNLRLIGGAWFSYLEDRNNQFPYLPVQPDWRYAGVRFSSATGEPYLDYERPLNHYLPKGPGGTSRADLLLCPADRGITGETSEVGTGRRSAYRSFGTSYRANACLFDLQHANLPDGSSGADAVSPAGAQPEPEAGAGDRPASGHRPMPVSRGLNRTEITTPPSRMVIMGDAIWYEVLESTGRSAEWHHREDSGNLLFLDGSVRFMTILPRAQRGPAVYDPVLPGTFLWKRSSPKD